MCLFRIKVVICGCNDIDCKELNPEIEDDQAENLPHGGHVVRVTEYYRESGICLGWFINKDPDRLIVRYGLDPRNSNSRQDCKNKTFLYDKRMERLLIVCKECQEKCTQPEETSFVR